MKNSISIQHCHRRAKSADGNLSNDFKFHRIVCLQWVFMAEGDSQPCRISVLEQTQQSSMISSQMEQTILETIRISVNIWSFQFFFALKQSGLFEVRNNFLFRIFIHSDMNSRLWCLIKLLKIPFKRKYLDSIYKFVPDEISFQVNTWKLRKKFAYFYIKKQKIKISKKDFYYSETVVLQKTFFWGNCLRKHKSEYRESFQISDNSLQK